jgi:hypothetical protein
MSVNDPSLLDPGTAVQHELPSLLPGGYLQKSGNGHGETSHQKIHVDAAGNLAKSLEPTLTAPPDDIVYPERADALAPQMGAAAPIPTPIIIRQMVSGNYVGSAGNFRLELRTDVDRNRPQNTASFDFYNLGSVITHFGSFRLVSPAITYTSTKVTIEGAFTGTVAVWANRVRIVINRNLIFQPAAPATVYFFQNTVPGSVYTCLFNSTFFRSVQLETDSEVGAVLFNSYNTADLPCPAPHRVLTTVKAYEEAGIQMMMTGFNNAIVSTEAGTDARWTESEMHASMVRHFSRYLNAPQWAVWLFAARRAVSSTLLGIMFDYLPGLRQHRQGCAVFQDTVLSYHPGTADYNRHLLYTYVHELGHAFNLLHSWDKGRHDSLSWMNYDWRYDQRNGAGSFWNNFNFIFDNGELNHMRHGFRQNVIMGGSDWAVGAGLEHGDAVEIFSRDMIENNSGLKLELMPVKNTYALGEPVVIEIKLRCMDMNGKLVNANLHPKHDNVRIGILKPNGKVCLYEALAHNCSMPEVVELTSENNTAYASSYIGYGKEGFYFDQPGFYKIKGAYLNKDGSIIQSEEISLRVKSPLSQAEDQIADKYFTSDAGALFYLLGSDSEVLQKGMDDFQEVSEKYKNNDLAVYADLVLGVNEAMKFKVADSKEQKVITRKRNLTAAKSKLGKVFAASKGHEGVDNITLNWAYRHLAKAYLLESDEKNAKATLKEMEDTFKQKKLKASVLQKISKQANAVLKNTK